MSIYCFIACEKYTDTDKPTFTKPLTYLKSTNNNQSMDVERGDVQADFLQ